MVGVDRMGAPCMGSSSLGEQVARPVATSSTLVSVGDLAAHPPQLLHRYVVSTHTLFISIYVSIKTLILNINNYYYSKNKYL